MGNTDRIIRFVLGAVLAAAWVATGNIIFAPLALIMFATSLISFCPLYVPFRFSTTKKEA
jgi:hypothetical protein